MMALLGLLIVAFFVGIPVYFVALFFKYKRRPEPGFIFWLTHCGIVTVWIVFVLVLMLGVWIKLHPKAAQIVSAPATSSAPAANPAPASDAASDEVKTLQSLHLPSPWWAGSDGDVWATASEADKQALAAALASASTHQNTAPFFYTNFNEKYDPSSNEKQLPVSIIFMELEGLDPAKTNPSFLGFSWRRHDTLEIPQGTVEKIGVFWPDGHSFIHLQKMRSDNTYTSDGLDGPWDGDIVTFVSNTTVSGNNFVIQTTAPTPSAETGTYQVSADGQELDMTEGDRPPARYVLVAQLVNNIDDVVK